MSAQPFTKLSSHSGVSISWLLNGTGYDTVCLAQLLYLLTPLDIPSPNSRCQDKVLPMYGVMLMNASTRYLLYTGRQRRSAGSSLDSLHVTMSS